MYLPYFRAFIACIMYRAKRQIISLCTTFRDFVIFLNFLAVEALLSGLLWVYCPTLVFRDPGHTKVGHEIEGLCLVSLYPPSSLLFSASKLLEFRQCYQKLDQDTTSWNRMRSVFLSFQKKLTELSLFSFFFFLLEIFLILFVFAVPNWKRMNKWLQKC